MNILVEIPTDIKISFTKEDIKGIAEMLFIDAMEENLPLELMKMAVMFNKDNYILPNTSMTFSSSKMVGWLKGYQRRQELIQAAAETNEHLEQS